MGNRKKGEYQSLPRSRLLLAGYDGTAGVGGKKLKSLNVTIRKWNGVLLFFVTWLRFQFVSRTNSLIVI